MLTEALAVAATALPTLRAWPQVRRIAIRRETSGVSTTSWTLMLVNFSIWATLGAFMGIPVLIATNVLAGLGAIAVLASLAVKGQGQMWRIPTTVAGTVVTSASLHAIGGTVVLGTIATVVAITMFLPQLVKVFKTSTAGVSPVTWWLAVASSVSWLSYGFAIGHPAIAAPHIVMLPSAIAILWRVYTTRENQRPVAIAQ
jgi:uncharacterized protein with PQ loop repeat